VIVYHISKMKDGAKSPPWIYVNELLWTLVSAAISIGLCAYLSSYYYVLHDMSLLIDSFGAPAVLVYAELKAQLPGREIWS
jgi:hypothetical protein